MLSVGVGARETQQDTAALVKKSERKDADDPPRILFDYFNDKKREKRNEGRPR